LNALIVCNGFCSAAVLCVRIAGAVSRSAARGNRCFFYEELFFVYMGVTLVLGLFVTFAGLNA
jgi:hypothetical protein